jgi:hypothetical protein
MRYNYSHFFSVIRREAKKRKTTTFDIIKESTNYLSSIEFTDHNHKCITMYDFKIQTNIVFGDQMNFFIKDLSLFYWLRKQPIKINITISKMFEIVEIDNSKFNIFLFHHKLINNSSIPLLIIKTDNEFIITNINSGDKNSKNFVCRINGNEIVNEQNILNNTKIVGNHFLLNECIDDIRFIFNVFLYIKCFPDYVKDGVPDDLTNKNQTILDRKINFGELNIKNKNVSISTYKNIENKSPHFRSGHFMHLESDRYVNKQHQIVWRSETMVKGFKAKTVIE